MKIFNTEKDKEKVYVQLNDIMCLMETNMAIPASIIDKVFGREMLIVDDSNRDEFVEFDDKTEVDFFKSVNWIINYKDYRDLSKEELKLLIEETQNEVNTIADNYNKLSNEEKSKCSDLYEKYIFLCNKYETLNQILLMKKDDYNIPFPLVPDSDGFSLGNDNPDSPYKLSVSLDPNKYLFYRIDGQKLKTDENVPENFIQTGLCLAWMNRKDIPSAGECEVSYEFSPDNKYLVINTRVMEKKEEKTSQTEEAKGFKRILNKLFNRKKKS